MADGHGVRDPGGLLQGEDGRFRDATPPAMLERGDYPADLKSMRTYFPRGAPPDPFTGKPFRYWLAKGLLGSLAEMSGAFTDEIDRYAGTWGSPHG